MYAPVKLDQNPINIRVRRLYADLHDVNGVDMEEADGVTLSPVCILIRALYVPLINHVTLCSMRAFCIERIDGADCGCPPELSPHYVSTEYISNPLPVLFIITYS